MSGAAKPPIGMVEPAKAHPTTARTVKLQLPAHVEPRGEIVRGLRSFGAFVGLLGVMAGLMSFAPFAFPHQDSRWMIPICDAVAACLLLLAYLFWRPLPPLDVTPRIVSVAGRSVEFDSSVRLSFLRGWRAGVRLFGGVVVLSGQKGEVRFHPFLYDTGIFAPSKSGRGALVLSYLATRCQPGPDKDAFLRLFPVRQHEAPAIAARWNPVVLVALGLLALLDVLLFGLLITARIFF